MRILVLGAGGMAGHVVAQYLREQEYDIDTVSGTNKFDDQTHLIDVTNQPKLVELLGSTRYDVVVNCIGLLVKPSEERKDLAVYLNSYLPHLLEQTYANTKTKLIHLSTDCVFSGKHAPYREDSWYDGELFYDRSKALGEVVNGKDLTFRMSIIGPDRSKRGVGLYNWFAQQTGELSGYTTAIWSGITTIELAKGIHAAIKQDLTGLYHLVPGESISKYELLKIFKQVFDRDDITITPGKGPLADKTLVNTRTDFGYHVPSYETMVREMRDWITTHKSFYKHYR